MSQSKWLKIQEYELLNHMTPKSEFYVRYPKIYEFMKISLKFCIFFLRYFEACDSILTLEPWPYMATMEVMSTLGFLEVPWRMVVVPKLKMWGYFKNCLFWVKNVKVRCLDGIVTGMSITSGPVKCLTHSFGYFDWFHVIHLCYPQASPSYLLGNNYGFPFGGIGAHCSIAALPHNGRSRPGKADLLPAWRDERFALRAYFTFEISSS